MDGLVSLAPVIAPLLGMIGALGGAWMMYRQAKKKNENDAAAAGAQQFIGSVTAVTEGFSGLLEQQRAVNAQTLERVVTLEARQIDLERKVEALQEEQRMWRRWKAAAVGYIQDLRHALAVAAGRPAPEPPQEIAADVLGPDHP
ncbi:hypothetical protein ACIP93_33390 [Streptomyces sp. NPDC088745]|uniref:hypothetical protein n=1 Tax=Streptomyces sp. NPDC088745 TaxID=3365884 RepID=UPI0037F1A40C